MGVLENDYYYYYYDYYYAVREAYDVLAVMHMSIMML